MINKERLLAHLNAMQASSTIEGVPGINRIAFTDEDWQGREYLIDCLKKLGLTLRYDDFGNVIGRYEGENPDAPAIMMGSHTDSVPQGGNYDGLAGIVAALEVVTDLHENKERLTHPLDIFLFMCEESSRFGSATLGSQAMRGQLSIERLQSLQDKKGNSLYEVLKSRGFNPDNIPQTKFTTPLKAFLELHIEQGIVLEKTGHTIGIVTGIAAPTRYKVHIHGTAGHSGATPMNHRHDGLCAAAEIILAAERIAQKSAPIPVVATVGVIEATPGVMNVIPGEVTLGLDIRSISAEAKEQATEAILQSIKEISHQREIPIDTALIANEMPLMMKESMIHAMESVAQDKNYNYMTLPSGAGHDAMNWGDYTDVGMIFIPCAGGVSHNPAESITIEDLVTGTEFLKNLILYLDKQ
ncbi:MAG: M20 family metallo-hydrolase [Veillonella sp.]|uniref:M20 family metallo-hydrolase n=1 Tax=Veillonella sp. TaxID=1926307 RepID=UPI0025F81497|nr:M20 family metallo-hydrolase [Veillonella sp.]MBE6079951.1 M20 family metallo-hydrolase [Veillonella sp.]